MGKLKPDVVQGCRSYDPKVLCRAYMKTETCVYVIMNNLAKTFNGYIIHARTKHLIYMLEDIEQSLCRGCPKKKKT